jgi:hypothetical protein
VEQALFRSEQTALSNQNIVVLTEARMARIVPEPTGNAVQTETSATIPEKGGKVRPKTGLEILLERVRNEAVIAEEKARIALELTGNAVPTETNAAIPEKGKKDLFRIDLKTRLERTQNDCLFVAMTKTSQSHKEDSGMLRKRMLITREPVQSVTARPKEIFPARILVNLRSAHPKKWMNKPVPVITRAGVNNSVKHPECLKRGPI